jgi:hypothetical protein
MRQGVAAIGNISSPSKEDQSRKAFFLCRIAMRSARKEERESAITDVVQIAKGVESDDNIVFFAGFALIGCMATKFCVHLGSQQILDGCHFLIRSFAKWSPIGCGAADLHNGVQSDARMYMHLRLGSIMGHTFFSMAYQHPELLSASAVLVMGEEGCYVQDTASLCKSNCSFYQKYYIAFVDVF